MWKYLLFAFVFLFQTVQAAKKKDNVYYPELRNDSVYNYEFDVSKLKVDGRNVKSFAATHSDYMSNEPERAYKNFVKRLEIAYINSANDMSMIRHGYLIDNENKTRFLLHIYIETIDHDGEHTLYCDIIDRENENKEEQVKSLVTI